MFGSDWEVTPEIIYSTKYPLIRKKSLFLSGHKINQNMEFGDIIYFILLVFFMILGFFNDSRKKKNKQKEVSGGNPSPVSEKIDETFFQKMERQRNAYREKTTPPPAIPPAYSGKEVHTQFQSSMDLVTDFKKESSLKSSIFVFDADSSFAQEIDSSDSFNEKLPASQKRTSAHPLVRDLFHNDGLEELKKGLIYGEIIQRKY